MAKISDMPWLILVLMTCVALLAVLLPLASPPKRKNRSTEDLPLYRRALADIDQNIKCGLVDPQEADVMKAEAARRLLARESETQQATIHSNRARTVAALTACVFIPILSIPLYLHVGRYAAPDQPLAERIAAIPGHKDTSKRIAELEAFIGKHPNDGRAYEMIAPFYQRDRRFEDAVRALETGMRLLGPSASRHASIGEAKVVAAQGEVLPEAIKDFEAALRIDPKDILSRYYLGVAAAQSGDREKASAIWSGLLADAPPAAEWVKQVHDDLSQLGTADTSSKPSAEPMAKTISGKK